MRLCDKDIESWLDSKKLVITPRPCKNCISGVTVDIRLGNRFRIFKNHKIPFIDLSESKEKINSSLKQVMSNEIVVPNGELFFLHPGALSLAITFEIIHIPNSLVAWLDGRSSLARLGLMVHATSHRIDPGWKGNIVLEFFNAGKVTLALKPGMFIGALSFEILSNPSSRPYNFRRESKYLEQYKVVSSRIFQDIP